MVPIKKSASEAEIEGVSEPYALASLELHPFRTEVKVGRGPDAVTFGGARVPVVAGPCAVESWEQLEAVAHAALGTCLLYTSDAADD